MLFYLFYYDDEKSTLEFHLEFRRSSLYYVLNYEELFVNLRRRNIPRMKIIATITPCVWSHGKKKWKDDEILLGVDLQNHSFNKTQYALDTVWIHEWRWWWFANQPTKSSLQGHSQQSTGIHNGTQWIFIIATWTSPSFHSSIFISNSQPSQLTYWNWNQCENSRNYKYLIEIRIIHYYRVRVESYHGHHHHHHERVTNE